MSERQPFSLNVFYARASSPPLLLAPMAGVTDRPFRALVREQGCDLACTEMVSAKAVNQKNPQTWKLLDIEGEFPVGVQLFGSSPEVMAAAAAIAQAKGAALVDINMGCPVPKIVGNGEGAALMQNPRLAEEIVRRVSLEVSIPVTVKIRAGWDENSLNAPSLAKRLAQAGAGAITVHGRSREQYYSGKADWGIIRQTVQAVDIPVIGNGDIWSGQEALARLEETGCAGLMLARGALGNPWLFPEIRAALKGQEYKPPTKEARFSLALRHFRQELEYRGGERGTAFMRKHLAWYIKGLPGAAALRNKINTTTDPKEVEKLMAAYLEDKR